MPVRKMSKQLVWLSAGDHRYRTIMIIAIKSLIEAGYAVTVIDRAPKVVDAPYQHISLNVGFASNDENLWLRNYNRLKYLYYLFLALLHTLKKRSSFIIVTLPHIAPVGWLAATLLRSRLIYYPFELFGEQYEAQVAKLRQLEVLFIKRGINALITQNEERAKIYVQERGCRVTPTIVHNYKNYKTIERSGKLRKLLGLADGWRIVLYEGFLIRGRYLDKLIQSSVYLPEDTKLVFVGEISPWWKEKAEPLLAVSSVKQKVLVSGWIPQEELMDYVADAEVGVIIYDNLVRNNYYCEPGKLSDYVLAGVPVVAPNFPTIGPVIDRYCIGATFTTFEPEELARAINSVLSTPRNVWKQALDRARKELVWETQEAKFLEAVGGISKDGKRAP